MEKIMDELYKSFSENEAVKSLVTNINGYSFKITFHMHLADMKRFNEDFTEKINKENKNDLEKIYPGVFYKVTCLDDSVTSSILSGNVLLDFTDVLYIVLLQNQMNRTPEDSLMEPNNIIGSRDGFIENIDTNIALIQKRIKSSCLSVKKMVIGKRSKTNIAILHIKDITDPKNTAEVINKLSHIDTDGITSIKDITYVFERNSLFPLTAEIGSPDIAANDLFEGRIIILIDQIPVAVCLPVNFMYFLTLKESRHLKPLVTIYNRILLAFIFFFSVYFLGIYASAVNYHSKNLSLIIISEIKSSLKGSTLPLFLEFIFLNFLFDLMRLSSSKSPNISLQNVIVTVGGLLIGQNAVSSGFISSFNLVVTAICYLSSYALTNNQRFITSLSILRLFILFSGMLLGMFGVLLSIILSLSYLNNLYSLNTPYLSPLSPFYKRDFIKVFLSRRIFKKKKRDISLNTIDQTRGNI